MNTSTLKVVLISAAVSLLVIAFKNRFYVPGIDPSPPSSLLQDASTPPAPPAGA